MKRLVKRYPHPGAQRFAVWFCSECGTRMPHKVKTTDNMLIPAGVLDADPGMRPENSIFWKSKSAWYVSPTSCRNSTNTSKRPVRIAQNQPWASRCNSPRLALSIGACLSLAQPYPAKPVRIIVAFPAGGGTDIVARTISPKLAEALGQQVVIDDRGGASGLVGTELGGESTARRLHALHGHAR